MLPFILGWVFNHTLEWIGGRVLRVGWRWRHPISRSLVVVADYIVVPHAAFAVLAAASVIFCVVTGISPTPTPYDDVQVFFQDGLLSAALLALLLLGRALLYRTQQFELLVWLRLAGVLQAILIGVFWARVAEMWITLHPEGWGIKMLVLTLPLTGVLSGIPVLLAMGGMVFMLNRPPANVAGAYH